MSTVPRWLSTGVVVVRFYVLRSLALDVGTWRMRAWPARSRERFLMSKAWALAHLALGRPASVVVSGIRLRVTTAADLGTLQTVLSDVHDELVVPGLVPTATPVVVDVGANIGQFTAAVKAFWPRASVRAFEPDPDVHAVLADNARRLGGVATRAVALGARASSLPLHRHHLSSMSTLRPGLVETYDAARAVLVPVVRLDDQTADLGAVDLLKVDVEGYEVEVLRGATDLLRRTRLLLVEVSLARSGSSTEPDVLAAVAAVRPAATVVGRGRPIGGADAPICQDVLIDLGD